MKWVWWIGGAICYLIYKNEFSSGTTFDFVALVLILLFATMMGERADRSRKILEQQERDREANDIARQLEMELKAKSAEPTPSNTKIQ